jgi:hypothetical protein
MYADDVIIFAAPTVGEAQALATILSIFGDATGLRTNLAKCSITPIYGAEEIMAPGSKLFYHAKSLSSR